MNNLPSPTSRQWRGSGFVAAAFLSIVAFPIPTHAATEVEYEGRIAALELRIQRLEKLIDRLTPPVPQASVPPGATDRSAPAPPDSGTSASAAPSAAEPSAAKSELPAEDRDALQQLYVVRDAAVTLKPGRWESSLEFTYTRDDAFLQSSWALGAAASLRYGAPGGWEFGIRVPYDWTHRETESVSPGGIEVDLAALGDISVDASKLVFYENQSLPGVVINGGVTIPSGVNPYSDLALTPGRSPSNPFTFYRNASGHYSADLGFELFKTVDPFAYFGGVQFRYPFERDAGGIPVFPGYTIAYNFGATVSLGESTSLGVAVLGSINTPMTTVGVEVSGSGTMPVSSTISILQRLSEGFYVEPSLTVGLTNDAPDATLALKTTKKF